MEPNEATRPQPDHRPFLLGLAIGAGALLLAGAIRSRRRRRERRHAFLGPGGERFHAAGSSDDGLTIRRSDIDALRALRRALGDDRLPEQAHLAAPTDLDTVPGGPLLLLGSPQDNALAGRLQQELDLPFHFLSLTPDHPRGEAIEGLYAQTGQLYTCSLDPTLGEVERRDPPPSSGQEYDYGLLVLGAMPDEEGTPRRIIWAGGLHPIGTLGVVKWALEHVERYDWDRLGNVCFLIRVGFSLPRGATGAVDPADIDVDDARPELAQGPSPWRTRPAPPPRVGLLCDLGNVLVTFERRRLAYNLGNLLGVRPDRAQWEQIQALRGLFERGEQTPAGFLAALREILYLSPQDDAALELAWCDIFWRNEPVIALLERLARREGVRLVMVSNTDPLRLAHTLGRMGLGRLFDRDRVVASCDPDVRPKGEDGSMLHKAIAILEREFQGEDFTPLLIDDVRVYAHVAQEEGLEIVGIHYQSYPQLVYALRPFVCVQ